MFVVEVIGRVCTKRIQCGGEIIENAEMLSCIDIVLLHHLLEEGHVHCFALDFCISTLSLQSLQGENIPHQRGREAIDLAETKVAREHASEKEREAGVQIEQRNRDGHRLFSDHWI